MVLKFAVLESILEGKVDLAFRRWKRPTVKAGGQLKTALGVLNIHEVTAIKEADISDEQALRAGYSSLKELLLTLAGEGGTVYRISLGYAGEDPRIRLREQVDLNDSEWTSLIMRLERWDRAALEGPWTRRVLAIIATQTAVPARQLAAELGWETLLLKRRVRQLKELGLTESLEVGYRLSPRGEATLQRFEADHVVHIVS